MRQERIERHLLAGVEARIFPGLAGGIEPEDGAVRAGIVDEGDLGRRVPERSVDNWLQETSPPETAGVPAFTSDAGALGFASSVLM